MKRRIGLLLALTLALAAPAAYGAPGVMLGLNGMFSLPMGDFADENLGDAKSGFGGGIDICLKLNDQFMVGVDGNWMQNKHGAEGTVEDLGGGMTLTADKDKFITMSGGVHGKYMFPLSNVKMAPYALAGVGMYQIKEDYEYTLDDNGTITKFTDESDNAGSETKVGFKLGAGFLYHVTDKMALTFQGEYNHVPVEGSSLQFAAGRVGVALNLSPAAH